MNAVVPSGERDHRRYSPSQSERFFNCPGSSNLIDKLPARATSDYALEGVIAHAVLEAGIRNHDTNVLYAIKHSPYADHELVKGYHNFHYSIQDALDHIWTVVEELDFMYGDVVLGVEVYVDPPSNVAPGETGGFVDIYIYTPSGRKLIVIDYKHGAGVAKAAEGNTQVKQYGCGLMFGPRAIVKPEDIDTVTLTIIQPRAFHPEGDIRSYDTTPIELYDYLIELDAAIIKCQDETAPLNPGLSWCQFCPARSGCPALARSAVAAILNDTRKDVSDLTANALPDLKSLDVGRMAYILSMKPVITQWLNAIEGHADELSRSGIDIPGFKRVESQARREYYGNREEIADGLASMIGCDRSELYKEPALLNITDMEEKVIAAFKARVGRGKKKQAAEHAAQMFAFFTLKKSSGNTVLVPLDDKRPAINKAQNHYGNVAGLIPSNVKETT